MKTVYFDNAATTPMLPEVIEVMNRSMQDNFGNPSSIHQYGRKAKTLIETARKSIAKQLNVLASEIIFTSGGTEADNLLLLNAVQNLGVKRIITSKLEHHAVLNTVTFLQSTYGIQIDYVSTDNNGVILLSDLEKLLSNSNHKTLVSLMYVNNEIGNILPVEKVSSLCQRYNAFFHSDAVQAIGHISVDLKNTPIDFIAASAHKFHGPKGVGFAYVKKGISIKPLLHGGEQEKGARSGTENVHAILGMEKALSVSYANLEQDIAYVKKIKQYFVEQLKAFIPEVKINGDLVDETSCTIVNVRFPIIYKMLLFNLDLSGVIVSGGSACQSGASKGSHVLKAFLNKEESEKTSVRFSFSKLNTIQEVDYVVEAIKKVLK